jgi:peptidoglycan biosynthesis protein MviN/MurJ (putative lipid II flippase)
MALSPAFIELLLADPANMRRVVRLRRGLMACGIIVALIQTEMLKRLGCWRWPLDDDGIKRLREQFRVVHVGSGNGDPKGPAIVT